MTRIIIGAADTHYDGWLSTNINALDIRIARDFEFYAPIECAVAEHVWEHLTLEEGRTAADNCHRYIPRLRVAVPDGNYPDAAYVARARLGECKGDHWALYTLDTLRALFEGAGYEVEPLEWWDTAGEFHYRPWDVSYGPIYRSLRFDSRNGHGEIGYTSIIIDCKRETT
jgi:predicted SAM-dependent methyltransferase